MAANGLEIIAVELEGIDLDVTSFVWPIYRGCEYVAVEIRQDGARFDEFQVLREAMQDEFAGGLTLHVEYLGPDGEKREQDFKQIQLVDLTKEDTGPTGTRIVIADVRYLLSKQPMAQSWNLLYANLYQADTALSKTEPMLLLKMLERLPAIFPKAFANRMAEGFLDDIQELADAEIPPDQFTAGQSFSAALGKLLEQWAVDLVVLPEGQFYFANRKDTPEGTLALLEKLSETFDWIGDPPDFTAIRSTVQIPTIVHVPYWEDHNLEIPFVAFDDRATATQARGGHLASAVKYPHGLIARQVFELGDTYTYLDELLDTLGFVGQLYEVSPSERHSLGAVMMNPILFDSHLSPDGHTSDESDYLARIAAVTTIRDGVRKLLSIEPEVASQRASWMNLTPGLIDGSGVIRDARPRGDATVLLQTTGDEKAEKDAPPPKIGIYLHNTEYSESLPFTVQRVHEGELVARVEFRNFDSVPKADGAIPGKPRDLDMLNLWDTSTLREVPEKLRKAAQKAGIDVRSLSALNTRENLQFEDYYIFAIYCVGRRHAPNDASKWWTIPIDVEADLGLHGDGGEVTLTPSEEMFCRRDHLYGLLGAPGGGPGTVQVEKQRPNGNDNFGVCMNREMLKRDALRRARAYVESLASRAGPTLPFAELDAIGKVRIQGHIDSMSLHVNGGEITGEISVGPRPNEVARVRQAYLDQAARKAEIGGKRFK